MAFNLQRYMTGGVVRVVTDALRATASSPEEAAYMRAFALAAAKASKQRFLAEHKGDHIPPFLIASITSSCNLHCAGCYSRSNNACCDTAPVDQLSAQEWDRVFREAQDLGISFILLAGGEPLIRADVIKQAAGHPAILFPIFTNGTYLAGKYLDLFDEHRNLLPIISIEGDETTTNARRGDGVFRQVVEAMDAIHARGMIFGASVTVTTQNIHEVYSDAFLDELCSRGCKAVIYVEYVPVTEESTHLAPDDGARLYMQRKMKALHRRRKDMVFIAFPGDEKRSGGCVAAGRGFFHINSHGGAEPCPFSPYSDVNIRGGSLRDALQSPLFRALQDDGLLLDNHVGGCTLHMNKDKVEALLQKSTA